MARPKVRLQAEKAAWWENPGSLVLTPHTAHRYFPHCLAGWYSGNQSNLFWFYLDSVQEGEYVWAHIYEGFSEGSEVLKQYSTFPGSLIRAKGCSRSIRRKVPACLTYKRYIYTHGVLDGGASI